MAITKNQKIMIGVGAVGLTLLGIWWWKRNKNTESHEPIVKTDTTVEEDESKPLREAVPVTLKLSKLDQQNIFTKCGRGDVRNPFKWAECVDSYVPPKITPTTNKYGKREINA